MALETFVDLKQFLEDVEKPIDDIMEAMRSQTAKMAQAGIHKAGARRQKARYDAAVKALEAQLTSEYRGSMNAEAVKEAQKTGSKPERITQNMIEVEVMLDPRMKKLVDKQIEADEIYQVCVAVHDTYRTRSDMIQSLGHMTRAQMQTGIVIEDAKKSVKDFRARHAARKAGKSQQG